MSNCKNEVKDQLLNVLSFIVVSALGIGLYHLLVQSSRGPMLRYIGLSIGIFVLIIQFKMMKWIFFKDGSSEKDSDDKYINNLNKVSDSLLNIMHEENGDFVIPEKKEIKEVFKTSRMKYVELEIERLRSKGITYFDVYTKTLLDPDSDPYRGEQFDWKEKFENFVNFELRSDMYPGEYIILPRKLDATYKELSLKSLRLCAALFNLQLPDNWDGIDPMYSVVINPYHEEDVIQRYINGYCKYPIIFDLNVPRWCFFVTNSANYNKDFLDPVTLTAMQMMMDYNKTWICTDDDFSHFNIYANVKDIEILYKQLPECHRDHIMMDNSVKPGEVAIYEVRTGRHGEEKSVKQIN